MTHTPQSGTAARRRYQGYVLITALISLVADGWAGKPRPFLHQLLLLPCTLCFAGCLGLIVRVPNTERSQKISLPMRWTLFPLACFELLGLLMIAAEAKHFSQFGYRLTPLSCFSAALGVAGATCLLVFRRSSSGVLGAILLLFASGMLLSIASFPLNYLRSDMLPVIGWADHRLWLHQNPYTTMHVGNRLYDFPYLPGMLVAYLPMIALGLDLRWATFTYTLLSVILLYASSYQEQRKNVAYLIGIFLLCPFLQYRHDLYLQPHWFSVTVAAVLLVRGRLRWSAFAWGVSCAIYQLSWVVLPFFLLHIWLKQGIGKALRALAIVLSGFLLIVGPFLSGALGKVEHNTLGQWNQLSHALADPINASYWLTFLIRPDELRWVQATVLVTLFFVCVYRRACITVADTFRYMAIALALFIPLNVLVDGYFYLTLLLFLLFYVAAANGWLQIAEGRTAKPSTIFSSKLLRVS